MNVLEQEGNESKKLLIKTGFKIYSININDIYFFEKFGRKIEIILKDRRLSFYSSFVLLEKVLDKGYFYRCHKSYMVNIKKNFFIEKNEIIFLDIKESALVSKKSKNELLLKMEENRKCS